MPGAIIIEGHIQGLANTRALGEAGIPVVVVDRNDCIARYSGYCRKFFRSPDFITDDFAFFLAGLAITENLGGYLLLPSNDHAVYTIARHRALLEKHYRIITPDISVIDMIYDKVKLTGVARRAGVPVPATMVPGDSDKSDTASMSFPVITKGRNGLTFYKTTGRKAFLSVDADEYCNTMARLTRLMDRMALFTQEVIPPCEEGTISFTAFSERGVIKTWWTGRKVREHPLRFGTATFCESVMADILREPSERLLRELDYTGICEIEYLRDLRDGQYKLIEINARTWLWTGLARNTGVDYACVAYDYAMGREPVYPASFKAGVRWANRITDFVWSVAAMLKGRLSLGEYVSSYRGRVVDALWCRGDNKPVLMYLLFLFRFLRSR